MKAKPREVQVGKGEDLLKLSVMRTDPRIGPYSIILYILLDSLPAPELAS